MPFDKTGIYLTDLLPEWKEELCRQRLLHAATYDNLVVFIREQWEINTSKQTVSNFFKSHEGVEILEAQHERIRKEYQNKPLIEKATRVMAYQKRALELSRVMDAIPIGEEGWLELSAEYRQYLKMIKDEIEGSKLKLEGSQLSPAEWWAKSREEHGSLEDNASLSKLQ